MSGESYLAAAGRLRAVLDALGPFRGPCLCGHPDARHRQADAMTGSLVAGDTPEEVAEDHLSRPGSGALVVLEVAVAVLAADRRLHGVTAGRAARLDREVWKHGAPPEVEVPGCRPVAGGDDGQEQR